MKQNLLLQEYMSCIQLIHNNSHVPESPLGVYSVITYMGV